LLVAGQVDALCECTLVFLAQGVEGAMVGLQHFLEVTAGLGVGVAEFVEALVQAREFGCHVANLGRDQGDDNGEVSFADGSHG